MDTSTKQNYIIRKYNDGDEINIIQLMETISGPWHSNDYWKWKYKDNPYGFFKDLLWLAVDGSSTVGQYAIVPVAMTIAGNDVLCSQSVDTATHPQYRRMGIFEETAKMTYQAAIEHQMPLTYGFANVGPSYKGFLSKLNWNHVFFLVHFIRLFNSGKILNKYTKNKILLKIAELFLKGIQINRGMKLDNSILIEQVENFPMEIDVLSSKIAQEYKFAVKRSQEYLNHRIMNPDATYNVYLAKETGLIVGYAIVVITSKTFKNVTLDVAIIADLVAQKGKDNAIHRLLNHIEKIYQAPYVDAITCTVPSSHRYSKILKMRGYLKLKTKMGFIVRRNYDDPLIQNIDLTDQKDWFVTHLDSDHV